MNARQKRFADEYLIDNNATQAAIRAGYSEKTAYVQGPRLLENVEIKKYIDEQEKKKSEKAKKTVERKLPTLEEVFDYWRSVMENSNASEKDRLRASENIAKVRGAFIERVDMAMAVDADVRASVTVSDSDRDLLDKLAKRLDTGDGADG